MFYQEYLPIRELASVVKCIWLLEDEAEPRPHGTRVLPDGCTELIFHYGERYLCSKSGGEFELQPQSFFFGQLSQFINLKPTGRSGIIAVRFFPHGAHAIFHCPLSGLTNRYVEIKTLLGLEGEIMTGQLDAQKEHEGKLQVLNSFLLSRLKGHHFNYNAIVYSVETLFETGGQARIEDLAKKTGYSRRHLERIFTDVVGLSPKTLAGIARFHKAMKLLKHNKTLNLTEIAHECGYYDQPHFIKDFWKYSGQNPSDYIAAENIIGELFISE